MIVTIVMIVIININIQDKLVIMIPLGVIVMLNTPPVEVMGIRINKDERGSKRDDRRNREGVIEKVGR